MDLDLNGSISFFEFVAALLEEDMLTDDNLLWHVFHLFDRNGRGKLGHQELEVILRTDTLTNMTITETESYSGIKLHKAHKDEVVEDYNSKLKTQSRSEARILIDGPNEDFRPTICCNL